MIEILPESAGCVIGFQISGDVTDEDYMEVFIPAIDLAAERYGTVRVLVDIVDFKGEDFGAMTDDLIQDTKVSLVEREAIIGGEEWEKRLLSVQPAFFLFSSTDVRFFKPEHRQEAWRWVSEGMRDLVRAPEPR
ncbi:SpoIIAA family protein [Methanofollis fontis]|uniref:STAS/SEC14 domain-containing protein n=1 Tax=Methanofollis fontis TaxID=2052832 RepID=A0A483CSC6_9EURY|nr:STAS/SEC14 domain-containing protein [Methanofollis fontis]TAJ44080.1 hypothetical protein CUJ86_08585 [Methanofollis fontis]